MISTYCKHSSNVYFLAISIDNGTLVISVLKGQLSSLLCCSGCSKLTRETSDTGNKEGKAVIGIHFNLHGVTEDTKL